MVENLQERLHQTERKRLEGANICTRTRWEIESENCSKTVLKTLEDKIYQKKHMKNFPVTLKTFLTQ